MKLLSVNVSLPREVPHGGKTVRTGDAEQHHPRYEEARRAEAEACRRGDFNFPGIGLEAAS